MRILRSVLGAALCAVVALPLASQSAPVTVSSPPRGDIGLVWALDPDLVLTPLGATGGTRHPTVAHVFPDSPAERAGLQVGDTILAVDGIDSREGPLFRDRTPGRRLVVRIRRGAVQREISLVVGEPGPPRTFVPPPD